MIIKYKFFIIITIRKNICYSLIKFINCHQISIFN